VLWQTGDAVRAGAREIEFEGAAEVAEDGRFAGVGVRQRLAEEGEIAGLLDERGHGVEEPEAVVGAIARRGRPPHGR